MIKEKKRIEICAFALLIVCVMVCLLALNTNEVAYAERTSSFGISSVLTGKNSSSYFVFNDAYTATGANKVKDYFTGSITQKNSSSFSLEVSCSDTSVISKWNNGDYYYSSDYTVSADSNDSKALILVFGSDTYSDFKGLDSYKSKSSKDLLGNVIKSDKTIKMNGTSSVTLEFTTAYKYIWYQVVYQWCSTTAHSNSYLVAGQSERFTVDRTAPTGTLSGGSNGGITNKDVTFSWSEEGCSATLNGTSYSSGNCITSDGSYSLVLKDAVENSSTYTFTIDKTSPSLSTDVSNGGYTNKQVTMSVSDANFEKLYYKTPGASSWSSYSSDTYNIGTANGLWQFYATDKAGNESRVYSFTFDNVAPSVTAPSKYNNSKITFSAKDLNDVTIEYWNENNTKKKVETKGDSTASVSIDATIENFGTWHFVAYDKVGNRTSEYTSTLYYRDTFGNQENVKNSYKVPSYYAVRLSDRYFSNCAGTYSFSNYENALNFAIGKEWEYRVGILSGGKWSYVNISNESVSQIYENKADLDEAIKKYAMLNISERQLFSYSKSSNAYKNPTDADGVTSADALTLQRLTMPAHLSEYGNLPLYFISHDFAFLAPAKGISGNNTKATIRYISNGISAVEKSAVTINYNESIETILKFYGIFNQGYYLIEESDDCGNVEQYVVYLDTQAPTLLARVEYGSGEADMLSFEQYYVEMHIGVMLYALFDVADYIDFDECAFLIINGRNMQSAQYLLGDDIPVLCFSNGYYGTYNISIYDRSRNILSFDIKIAGEEATLKHSSLTNETRCVLTLSCGDPSNAITSIEFFKITYDGEYVALMHDDDGTPISAETLSYVIRTGGKYVVRYVDIYGRVIESEPMFYMKGLPTGILRGVKENGITNKDVTFEYSSNYTAILYVWQNGGWVVSSENMSIEEKVGYNIASISAGVITSNIYKYFLYVTEDKNLFVEYQFEIDCIAPDVEIRTQEKNIDPEMVVNEPFFITWDESNLTAYYYNKNSSLGELGQTKYTKDTIISIAGTYVFMVYDSVKNLTSFTVTLDNVVTYSIEGAYTRLDDGSYISKTFITLTVSERTAQWNCTSSNDFYPINGQRIDIDGTYILHVEDLYQNVLVLTIIIDNLPPTARIESSDGQIIPQGARTNKFFAVYCDEENVTITYSINNLSFVAYEGQFIDAQGSYTFRLADRMNNIQSFIVILDTEIDYTLKGVYLEIDGRYVSKSWLTLTVDEQYSAYDVANKDGLTFRSGDKIDIEGVYMVTICDIAGNVVEVVLEIDKTAPSVNIKTTDGQAVEANTNINTAFAVCCDEDTAIIFVAGKDLNYAVYDGSVISAQGIYNFKVVDRIGNENAFSIEIDKTVNYTVRGMYVKDGVHTFISKNSLVLEMQEEYRNFYVESDNDVKLYPGERVDVEGCYTIEIEDMQGNVIEVIFIIDKTAPTIELTGVEPKNTTKNDVKVVVDGAVSTYYTLSGTSGKTSFVKDILLNQSGSYTIVASDLVGNERTTTFKIDKEVSATVTPGIVADGQILSDGVSFQFQENMQSITLYKDGAELAYRTGKISEPGNYVMIVEDLIGNVREWSWSIISATAQDYVLEMPHEYNVSVLLSGNVVSDAVVDGRISLNQNGYYVLSFEHVQDSALNYSVELVVDRIPPTVEIEVGKSQVVIKNPSKDNLSYELYKDKKKIDFSIGQTLTGVGKYKLIVYDELGNKATYEFELNYVNNFGIIVIVIACVFIIVATILIIRSRRRQRIK